LLNLTRQLGQVLESARAQCLLGGERLGHGRPERILERGLRDLA
jgi:hypothetical protein